MKTEKLRRSAVSGIKIIEVCSESARAQQVAGRAFYSLSYRYAGEIGIEADGRAYTSGAGSVTFIPKGQTYVTEITSDTRMVAIHFTLTRDIDTGGVAVIEDSDGVMRPYFDRLASFSSADPCDLGAMALFYQLLAELENIESGRAIPAVAADAKREIERCFSDSSLSISELAGRLGVSDSYLRRIFGEVYGISPLAYLTLVRIRYAKNMLESEFFSVEEIGRLSGFGSSGYFIQCFRRETGETPGAYRKRKTLINPSAKK